MTHEPTGSLLAQVADKLPTARVIFSAARGRGLIEARLSALAGGTIQSEAAVGECLRTVAV